MNDLPEGVRFEQLDPLEQRFIDFVDAHVPEIEPTTEDIDRWREYSVEADTSLVPIGTVRCKVDGLLDEEFTVETHTISVSPRMPMGCFAPEWNISFTPGGGFELWAEDGYYERFDDLDFVQGLLKKLQALDDNDQLLVSREGSGVDQQG